MIVPHICLLTSSYLVVTRGAGMVNAAGMREASRFCENFFSAFPIKQQHETEQNHTRSPEGMAV